ncbi:Enoyl-CoA delta isomerase 2, mitochondrial [Balamuthia mandrillaris]
MDKKEEWKALATWEKDGVFVLCLNRPQRKNAFNRDMYEECIQALALAAAAEPVRAVLLTGSGDYFSSGNDLANFLQYDPETLQEQLRQSKDLLTRFVKAFLHFPKPIVAAINGPAVGIATTILGHCDFVYGHESCTFHTPFMSLAQSPEGCSSLLFPECMGRLKANEMLLLGKKFSAEEALSANLLNAVYYDKDNKQGETFVDRVFAVAKQLAEFPPQALQLSKKLIKSEARMALLEKSNADEVELLGERWASEECMQAIMKFMMRRQDKKANL